MSESKEEEKKPEEHSFWSAVGSAVKWVVSGVGALIGLGMADTSPNYTPKNPSLNPSLNPKLVQGQGFPSNSTGNSNSSSPNEHFNPDSDQNLN